MTNSIDLTVISNKLAMQLKGNEKAVTSLAKKPIFYSVEKIQDNYPQTKEIDNNIVFFKLFVNPKNSKDVLVSSLFLVNSDAQFKCVLPDLNHTLIEVDDVLELDFQNNIATVIIQGVEFVVFTKPSQLGQEKFDYIYAENITDKDNELTEILFTGNEISVDLIDKPKEFFQKLDTIPKGDYDVILTGKITTEHKTPLANFEGANGVFKNVMCNSLLSRILRDKKTHSIKIGDKITIKTKTGMQNKVEISEIE